jgi:hypothetical protein
VAVDRQGRLLFIFSRYPYTMKELNDILLGLPLAIDNAMHMDGGPPASLSIHAGGVDLDLNGSFETGALESDAVPAQVPIHNRRSRAMTISSIFATMPTWHPSAKPCWPGDSPAA